MIAYSILIVHTETYPNTTYSLIIEIKLWYLLMKSGAFVYIYPKCFIDFTKRKCTEKITQ